MKTRTVFLFFVGCVAGSIWAGNGTWTSATGGNWSDTANWAGSTPASGSGSTAYLTTGAGTVTNDVLSLALLDLQLSGSGFTLAGNTLTLDSAGFIQTLAGNHELALPLTLSGTTTVSVASGQTLTVSGAVSGNGNLKLYGGRTVLTNANTYAGPTVLVTGILEIASVDALGSSSADPANLVLGEGTFRYTGPSATLTRGYTLLPGVSSNRAAVIDITNANTTLTIAGKVAAPGGSFIKTGEGTVAYTYPGYQEFNKSRLPNKENGAITYDVNGVAATNEYAYFTLEKGRMILGAPGQTNLIYAASGWIGCKTLASPRMDIIGGYTRFINGWLTIGRGTGTAASPQSPSLNIRDAVVSFEGSGICLDNANGTAPHRCRPSLSVSNSVVQTVNFLFGEDGNCTGRVDVGASSTMNSSMQTDHRYGMSVSASGGAAEDMVVTFDGASTNSTYLLRVGTGGKLIYKGNSVLFLDHTQTQVVMSTALQSGLVRFDGATLKQYTPQRVADWLINHTNLLVGANGLTIHTDSRAWLDNALLPDPASPGGSVTKIGPGTLGLGTALKVPLTVSGGAIALANNYSYTNVPAMPSYTFAAGTTAEVSGANALLGYTLASGSGLPTLDLNPSTFVQATERWTYNGSAMRRRDGLILLTRDLANEIGSAFLNRKHNVSASWTAEFTWRVYTTSTTPADGFALVFQNDARGTSALCRTPASSLGYAGTGANGITNSVALGFDVINQRLRLGINGVWITPPINQIPDIRFAPAYVTVAYDGTGVLSVRIRAGGNDYTYSVPVDLAATLGATDAYVGLTAATGGSPGMHVFSAFTFDAGTPAHTAVRHGGSVSLGASDTLTANLHSSARQNGFTLGTLAYASGSALNISAAADVSAAAAVDSAPPALTATNLWQLNGVARWKSVGAVATSTNYVNQGPGSVFTVNRYPISGSWTAKFHYNMGLANATTPADYFDFMLQNESQGSAYVTDPPASGLAIQWRFYDGSIHSTRLKVCTNSVTTVITDDIAPVTLTNGVPADFTVSYDDTAHAITVTSVQSGVGTNITVIPNINLSYVMRGAGSAYIGFLGRTGGSYSENIISDFTFTRTGGAGVLSAATPYLAFDSYSGSGALVKRGNASLGLVGDVDHATSNLSVRLEAGGLVLRKASLEPIDQNAGARSDWVCSSQAQWWDDNNLLFCPGLNNAYGTVTSSRRVRVADAWTASFTFLFGPSRPTTSPADAFCLFFHNDPRGPGYANGNVGYAGFTGMQNSFGVRWYFYPGNTDGNKDTVRLGRNGNWDGNALSKSFAPLYIASNVTDFVVHYDPATSNLTSIMTQGSVSVTNTFTEVNIPSTIGTDYAYVGFGGGTGGAYWDMLVRDFKLTYDGARPDALASQSYLASLVLTDVANNTVALDSSIVNGTYKVTAATVGAGATLGVSAASQPGTLSVDSVTQGGDATYAPASACTLSLSNVVGGATLVKSGSGTLVLTGAATTYTGNTVLSAGTLSLNAALLPTTTDLYVATGSTLNLGFTGKQYVHALYVNGVAMPGGRYTSANTAWITGSGMLVVTYPPVGMIFFLQ